MYLKRGKIATNTSISTLVTLGLVSQISPSSDSVKNGTLQRTEK